MGVMSERKKLLWHDYVSCLQCGGGGARLSMRNGREVGNSPGQQRSGEAFPGPHSESTGGQGRGFVGAFLVSAGLGVL